MKYNEIIGQEHAKRAIEIALTGNHSIKFIGNEEAEELKAVCDELKIKAIAVKPCYCGNYGDNELDCTCTIGELRRYFRGKKWNAVFDLAFEVKRPNAGLLINSINGKNDGEVFEEVEKRVIEAKKIEVKNRIEDEQAKGLMETAIKGKYLTSQKEISNVVAVAKTIAKLGGKNEITACEIAEALQYRPKK